MGVPPTKALKPREQGAASRYAYSRSGWNFEDKGDDDSVETSNKQAKEDGNKGWRNQGDRQEDPLNQKVSKGLGLTGTKMDVAALGKEIKLDMAKVAEYEQKE